MTPLVLALDPGAESVETIEAEDLREAMVMARAWADADWDTRDAAVVVVVDIADENGDHVGWIKEVFPQDEP